MEVRKRKERVMRCGPAFTSPVGIGVAQPQLSYCKPNLVVPCCIVKRRSRLARPPDCRDRRINTGPGWEGCPVSRMDREAKMLFAARGGNRTRRTPSPVTAESPVRTPDRVDVSPVQISEDEAQPISQRAETHSTRTHPSFFIEESPH